MTAKNVGTSKYNRDHKLFPLASLPPLARRGGGLHHAWNILSTTENYLHSRAIKALQKHEVVRWQSLYKVKATHFVYFDGQDLIARKTMLM